MLKPMILKIGDVHITDHFNDKAEYHKDRSRKMIVFAGILSLVAFGCEVLFSKIYVDVVPFWPRILVLVAWGGATIVVISSVSNQSKCSVYSEASVLTYPMKIADLNLSGDLPFVTSEDPEYAGIAEASTKSMEAVEVAISEARKAKQARVGNVKEQDVGYM